MGGSPHMQGGMQFAGPPQPYGMAPNMYAQPYGGRGGYQAAPAYGAAPQQGKNQVGPCAPPPNSWQLTRLEGWTQQPAASYGYADPSQQGQAQHPQQQQPPQDGRGY